MPAEPMIVAVLKLKIYAVMVFVSNNETFMGSLVFVTQGGNLMGFIQGVLLILMNVLVMLSRVTRESNVLIYREVMFADHVLLGIQERGIIVRILMNVRLIMGAVV